jgi:DnaK suppressor protein
VSGTTFAYRFTVVSDIGHIDARQRATGAHMNVEDYRRRLLEQEQELVNRLGREVDTARETASDQAEVGDLAVADELKEQYFTIAQTDSETLTQVRDALRRIEDGRFGRCVVDGKPIEEKRLEAVPWTPFCQKHQQEIEAGLQLRTPTM